MSHILRNRVGTGKRPTTTPGGGNVAPNRRMNGDGNRRMPGSQSQQQIQRPVITQPRVQVQQQKESTARQQQQQPQQKHLTTDQMVQEMVEDVKKLQELQQESKQRLDQARLARQKQLDQRAALESQLELLKYSNGEKRAQITRAHDLLSSSHRELTALQAASDRNGNGIRRMEEKLRKGLEARRDAVVLQQQVQLRLSVLAQKEHDAEQLHAKVLEKIAAKEKMCHELEQRQQELAKARQDELARIQKIAEMTANARAEGVRLEQQLAAARQLEVQAKQRAEAVARELEEEDKRSSAAVAELHEKIRTVESKKQDVGAKQFKLQKEMDEKRNAIEELRLSIMKYHNGKEPLESVSPKSVVEQLRLSVEREQQALKDQVAAKMLAEATLEKTLLETSKKEEDIVRINEMCQSVSERLREGEALEAERQASAEILHCDMIKMKDKVDALRNKFSELEKTHEEERIAGEKLIEGHCKRHQKLLDALAQAHQELETEKSLLEDLKKSNLETDKWHRHKLEEAKDRLDKAQKRSEQLREEAAQVPSKEEFEKAVQEEIELIKMARAFLAKDVVEEIESMKKKYVPLRDVDIVCDLSKSTEELAREAFGHIFTKCDDILRKARQQRDEKVQKLRDEEDQKRRDEDERKQRDAEDRKQRDEEDKKRRADAAKKKRDNEVKKKRDNEAKKKRDDEARKRRDDEARKQGDDQERKQRQVDALKQRKVTFQSHVGDSPQSNSEPKTGYESKLASERSHLPELQPKKEVVDIESDNSGSSPFVKADINSLTHSFYPDKASEAKPRDLLPAFTQASLEEDSVASAQEVKRVHWNVHESHSDDSPPGHSFDNGKPKTRRSYGTTKSGNGAILRHRRSSKGSKTSSEKEASHGSRLTDSDYDNDKYESGRNSTLTGYDRSRGHQKSTSDLGAVSRQRASDVMGVSVEPKKASDVMQKRAGSHSSKRDSSSNEDQLAGSGRGESTTVHDGSKTVVTGTDVQRHRPAKASSRTQSGMTPDRHQKQLPGPDHSIEQKQKFDIGGISRDGVLRSDVFPEKKSISKHGAMAPPDHQRELAGRDLSFERKSDLGGASRRGVLPERKKPSDHVSNSKHDAVSHVSRFRDTKKGETVHLRDGSAKKQMSEAQAKVDRKQSIDTKEGKAAHVRRDEAQSYDSERGTSVAFEDGTKKRKAGPLVEPSSKRSRTSKDETTTSRGSKVERPRDVSKTTYHKTSSKSSSKEAGKPPQVAKGSTQTSGISSMERVPLRRPKKKVAAHKSSRGLLRLDDIDEYNFHPH